VKTRLAATIGEPAAVQFYRSCVEHLCSELQQLPTTVKSFIYTADPGNDDAMQLWLGDRFTYRRQRSGDLGDRMQRAFADVFDAGYSKAVIVGTDIPSLTFKHIEQAFRLLDTHDVVLGPALDGGYYLLGMKSSLPLFSDMEWGTARVAHATKSVINSLNLSLAELEPLEDVDTEEAYRRHLL
jgi:rSAM/selenodomain-associated transferase 1